jgi:hypothetical protein
MEEVEIEATFDSEDTAHDVARAVNLWFAWANEGNFDEVPEFFEDFGVEADDFSLEDTDIDWGESPYARASGNMVLIRVESGETLDLIQELVETLGAYEVDVNEDVEADGPRDIDDDEEEESDSSSSSSGSDEPDGEEPDGEENDEEENDEDEEEED